MKEERARGKRAAEEMKELREKLLAVEMCSSEEAKSDLSIESLYNPQSFNLALEEEESKEPRRAAQATQVVEGRYMCQQCDLRFDTKASRKKHKKREDHKAKTIVKETAADSLQYLLDYNKGKLLAVMPDATIKLLTAEAPEGFKLDGKCRICKVSQGRIFLLRMDFEDYHMLTPDLVRSTFSVK